MIARMCIGVAVLLLMPSLLAAQKPKAKPPTIRPPSQGPTVKIPSVNPDPRVGRVAEEATRIDPGKLVPDLEVTVNSRSSLTVKNTGLGDVTRPTLLDVTIRLLPMSAANVAEIRRMGGEFGGEDNISSYRSIIAARCALPDPEFQAAIGPLAAGASQIVSPPGSSPSSIAPSRAAAIAGIFARPPSGSILESMELRIRCVYELTATVDANREVAEVNERNNEIVSTFQKTIWDRLLEWGEAP